MHSRGNLTQGTTTTTTTDFSYCRTRELHHGTSNEFNAYVEVKQKHETHTNRCGCGGKVESIQNLGWRSEYSYTEEDLQEEYVTNWARNNNP